MHKYNKHPENTKYIDPNLAAGFEGALCLLLYLYCQIITAYKGCFVPPFQLAEKVADIPRGLMKHSLVTALRGALPGVNVGCNVLVDGYSSCFWLSHWGSEFRSYIRFGNG